MTIGQDFDLTALVPLRHRVEGWARGNGLAGLPLYRFVVAVNEITTNAVRHGGGSGHLTLTRTGDRLHCTVTDHGDGLPAGHRPRLPGPADPGGRGLLLARHGTDSMTLTSTPEGTTVTLAVSTPSA